MGKTFPGEDGKELEKGITGRGNRQSKGPEVAEHMFEGLEAAPLLGRPGAWRMKRGYPKCSPPKPWLAHSKAEFMLVSFLLKNGR